MADDVYLSENKLVGRSNRPGGLLVDNPASTNPLSAVSVGQVQDLIAQGAAGFYRSFNPKSPLAAFVSNTTTETSALNAVFSMPRITHEGVFRMVAHGICRCTAGGPVNFTMRLRNTTDATIFAAATVSLITDADGNRPWRFDVVGEGNVVLSDSVVSVARLTVGAGSGGAALVDAMGQAAILIGTDPQNWDVMGQFSVANAGITATVYGCSVQYAIAGA